MKAKISSMKNKVSRLAATDHELDILERGELSQGKKDGHKLHRRFQSKQLTQSTQFI